MLDEIEIAHKPIEPILDQLSNQMNVVVIWGGKDWANFKLKKSDPAYKLHDWCLELGIKSFIIEDSDHIIQIEKPTEFCDLIEWEFK